MGKDYSEAVLQQSPGFAVFGAPWVVEWRFFLPQRGFTELNHYFCWTPAGPAGYGMSEWRFTQGAPKTANPGVCC